MYCIPLLELNELNDIQKRTLDAFFENFLPNGYITVSKAVEFTGMQERIVIDTFTELYVCGFLDIIYAVKCPECGHLIKKIEDINYFNYKKVNFCYACDEPIEISQKDIVILFAKKEKSPFAKGQHLNNEMIVKTHDGVVAPNDAMDYLKSISENFSRIVDMQTNKVIEDTEKNKELNGLKNKAYMRYKKNKKRYMIVSSIFRFVSLFILFLSVAITDPQGNLAVFTTVTIYAFQNVIDVLLKYCIVTDLNEIEREEMYKENKRKQKKEGKY